MLIVRQITPTLPSPFPSPSLPSLPPSTPTLRSVIPPQIQHLFAHRIPSATKIHLLEIESYIVRCGGRDGMRCVVRGGLGWGGGGRKLLKGG